MLLGAAKYLAATCNFEGTVHLIFQLAEEGGGGGRVMVEEGLFDKFPCDAVFALHNKPGIAVGAIAAKPGPLLAASDRWDIRIKARHPCRASASRHRSFRDRRADRAGAADDRQP